jgi:hypothetical protein
MFLVYTVGVALVVWLRWRCDRMRRVIRVHRSREPYEVPCGGGALTKFPQLTAWRRGVRR